MDTIVKVDRILKLIYNDDKFKNIEAFTIRQITDIVFPPKTTGETLDGVNEALYTGNKDIPTGSIYSEVSSKKELAEIVKRLVKDKYLDETILGTYELNLDGRLFYEDGGCANKAAKESESKVKAELLEKNQRELQNNQNAMAAAQVKMMMIQTRIQGSVRALTIWIAVGSIAAAVGGLIAAWYYITQLILYYNSSCH